MRFARAQFADVPDCKRKVIGILDRVFPEYETLFKTAFPDADDPITYDNMAMAVGAVWMILYFLAILGRELRDVPED